MIKPSILLIDNDKPKLAATRDFLVFRGYAVHTAQSVAEALRLARREVVHLAIVDVRLEEDHDEADWSGLHLAAELDPSIPKIMLTAHPYTDLAAVMRAAFGPSGNVQAVDFVFAKEGPEKLLATIEHAFKYRIQLNVTLKISTTKRVSWRVLVEQIKTFRDGSNEEKQRAELVLEDLTCRLFHNADAVRFLRTTPGNGPCTVAVVQPFYEGVAGTEVVVKFGPWESINQEVSNYTHWVEPFAGQRSTKLRKGPVKSRDMGAIAYEFVGGTVDSVTDFHWYFTHKNSSNRDLSKALEFLFAKSCKKWYEATRPPTPEQKSRRLDIWYREQLNLLAPANVKKLREAVNQLMMPGPFNRGAIKRLRGGWIQAKFDGLVLKLPEPLTAALNTRSSLPRARGKTRRRYFFPPPAKVAITHGDLHSSNILVNEYGRTWLIDFFKTGWGPALRDFAELESNIKFDLLGEQNLRARLELEELLLSPNNLRAQIVAISRVTPDQERALAAIQHLRELAYRLTETVDVREYYIGLLFYALKRIVGFTSSGASEQANSPARYHALLSAAMLCRKLEAMPPNGKARPRVRRGAPPQIFLSHARVDGPKVKRLYQRLTAAGFKPWMDVADLLPGEKWEECIERAIKQSHIFLACLSPQSINHRGILQKEIKKALEVRQGMLDRDIFLIPVCLEKCDVPDNLRSLQWVNLFEKTGWTRLLKAIQTGLERRT